MLELKKKDALANRWKSIGESQRTLLNDDKEIYKKESDRGGTEIVAELFDGTNRFWNPGISITIIQKAQSKMKGVKEQMEKLNVKRKNTPKRKGRFINKSWFVVCDWLVKRAW